MPNDQNPTTGFNDEWPDEDRAYDTWLDCDHAWADVDILTGELHCRCGYSHILTDEQLKREAMLQAEMMEVYYRECEQTERDGMAAGDMTAFDSLCDATHRHDRDAKGE